jgi:hypothetical protein
MTAAAVAGGVGLAGLGLSLALPLGATATTTEDAPDQPATAATDEATAEATDEARERPGLAGRIRGALDDLVSDGTLTGDQADAVAETLARHVPGGGPRGGHGGHGGPGGPGGRAPVALVETLAVALDLPVREVAEALRDGTAPADLIEQEGGDVEAVVESLVDDARAELDEAVEDGRLDAERAEGIGEGIEDRIRSLVENGLSGESRGERS